MNKTMSSKDLTNKIQVADSIIDEVRHDLTDIKNDLGKKIQIIHNAERYAAKKMEGLVELTMNNLYAPRNNASKIVFGMNDELYGQYQLFGNTIHPEFVRAPRNVFNITTSSGVLFRSNTMCYVDGIYNDDLKEAIKGEGVIDKKPFFEEYVNDTVSLLIEVDRSAMIGDTNFNTIEIVPYLEGSFDIQSIKVREINSMGVISKEVRDIKRVGKSRIILDRKYQMFGVEITVKLNYQNESGKYPFGLHSLQFLNADYKTDSYVVGSVEKSQYIEYIGNDILIKNDKEEKESTLSDEDISIYVSYRDGVLSGEIEVSTTDQIIPISRNAKKLYLNIPLKEALRSVSILEIETR